jgi:hypothetical protein
LGANAAGLSARGTRRQVAWTPRREPEKAGLRGFPLKQVLGGGKINVSLVKRLLRKAAVTKSSDKSVGANDVPEHILRLRNQERVELIMSFYRGLKEFRDMARKTHSGGRRFHFNDIDQLIETHLRPVKDMGHRLFRESKRGPWDGVLQAIFDMYFGILFHILLKAKENIRLQEDYSVRRLESLMDGIRQTGRASDLPQGVNELFDRLTVEFERDSEELEGELERARFMFAQLEKVFNRIIEVYKDNPTIIRSLYCQKGFFAELFPHEGVERLFARIYPKNGATEAYFLLGFDYLRSGHTNQAKEAFSLAIKSAKRRRLPKGRLRNLYGRHRDRALELSSGSGELALALQVRLREIESTPPLRDLSVPETRSSLSDGLTPVET